MGGDSREGRFGGCVEITASSASPCSPSSGGQRGILQRPIPSSDPTKDFPDCTPADTGPQKLVCPVPSCSLVFAGKTPHGYLWRHLKSPGIRKRTDAEKAVWLHLHNTEHDKLVTAGITPEQRKREANKVRARKARRTAKFELRARNIGITEKELVAQKVMIWEGMHDAKQGGDSVSYDAWVLLDFCTSA